MRLRLCAAQLFALGGCVCGAFSTTAPAQVFRVPINPASMLSDLALPGETLGEQSVLAISPEGDIMTRVEPSGGSSRVYLIRDGQAPQLLLQAGAAVPSTLDRLVVSVRSASFGRVDPLTNERPLRLFVSTRSAEAGDTGLVVVERRGETWRTLFDQYGAVPGVAYAGATFMSVPNWTFGGDGFASIRATIGGPGITGANRDVLTTLGPAGELGIVAQTMQQLPAQPDAGTIRTLSQFNIAISRTGVVASTADVSFGQVLDRVLFTRDASGVTRTLFRRSEPPLPLPVNSTNVVFNQPQLTNEAGQERVVLPVFSQRVSDNNTFSDFAYLISRRVDGSEGWVPLLVAGQPLGSAGSTLGMLSAFAVVREGTNALPAGSVVASVSLGDSAGVRTALVLLRNAQPPLTILESGGTLEGRLVRSVENSIVVNNTGDVLFMARLGNDAAGSILSWSTARGITVLVSPASGPAGTGFQAPRLVGATRDGRFAIATTTVFDYPVLGSPNNVWYVRVPGTCSDIDFNNDGIFPSDDDLVAYLRVLAGEACGACDSIDFNNDGLTPSDEDLLAFLRVRAGGTCD